MKKSVILLMILSVCMLTGVVYASSESTDIEIRKVMNKPPTRTNEVLIKKTNQIEVPVAGTEDETKVIRQEYYERIVKTPRLEDRQQTIRPMEERYLNGFYKRSLMPDKLKIKIPAKDDKIKHKKKELKREEPAQKEVIPEEDRQDDILIKMRSKSLTFDMSSAKNALLSKKIDKTLEDLPPMLTKGLREKIREERQERKKIKVNTRQLKSSENDAKYNLSPITEELYQYFDEQTVTWVNSYLYRYAYDTEGNEVLYEEYYWDGCYWSGDYKSESTFVDGYETTYTEYYWDYQSMSFIKDYKYEMSINEDGRNVEIFYFWSESQSSWLAYSKDVWEYDGSGHIIFSEVYYWNVTEMTWVGNYKRQYAYDAEGNRILFAKYMWHVENANWCGDYKYVYSYNEWGDRELYENWYGNCEVDSWTYSWGYKYEYEYDERGNQTLYTVYTWFDETQSFYGSYKYEYAYDEWGNQTRYAYYEWVNNIGWEGNYRYDWEFDEWGNELSEIYYYDVYSESGEWIPEWKDIFGFFLFTDECGNQDWEYVRFEYYLWDEELASWVGDEIYDYHYDEMTEEYTGYTYYLWDETTQDWYIDEDWIYTYDASGNVTEYVEWDFLDSELQITYHEVYSEFGQTLEEEYYWDSSLELMVGNYKEVWDYNADGLLILYIEYEWDETSSDFIGNYKNESGYDTDGYYTFDAYYWWDETRAEWEGDYKWVWTRNADNGKLESEIYYLWNSTDWNWELYSDEIWTFETSGDFRILSYLYTESETVEDSASYTYTVDGYTIMKYSYGNKSDSVVVVYNGTSGYEEWTWYSWSGSQWVENYFEMIDYDTKGFIVYYEGLEWDDSALDWVPDERWDAAYDSYGNLVLEVYYDWDDTASEWIGSTKYIYEWDTEDRQILYEYWVYDSEFGDFVGWHKFEKAWDEWDNQILYVEYNGWNTTLLEWEGSYKWEYTYNELGDELYYAYWYWDDDPDVWDWYGDYKRVKEIDEYCRITLDIYYNQWDFTTHTWIGNYKYEYAYDEFGNRNFYRSWYWNFSHNDWAGDYWEIAGFIGDDMLTRIERYQWDYDCWNWIGYSRWEDYYDESGEMIGYATWGWSNSDRYGWYGSSKEFWGYDENGREFYEYWTWDWTRWDWKGSGKYIMAYDDFGNQIYWESYYWNVTEFNWYGSSKWEKSYTATGLYETKTYYKWDWILWEWVGSSQYFYTYTANGDLETQIRNIWVDGAWIGDWKDIYLYDADIDYIGYEEYYWINNAWFLTYVIDYTVDDSGYFGDYIESYWNSDTKTWIDSYRGRVTTESFTDIFSYENNICYAIPDYGYYYQFTALGKDISYVLISGADGMSIDPNTGLLFWNTPGEPGIYPVSVKASTALGSSVVMEVNVPVLSDAPFITAVTDVPEDQGWWVFLEWLPSAYEYNTNTNYDDDKKSDGYTARLDYVVYEKDLDGKWIQVATVIPEGKYSPYRVPVHTFGNGVIDGDFESSFKVELTGVTFTDEKLISAEVNGFSIDNIVPGVPDGLIASLGEGSNIDLSWNLNEDDDFAYFSLYRATTQEFDITGLNPLAKTIETQFTDVSDKEPGVDYFYKLVATDASGNKSAPSDAVSATVTGIVSLEIPSEFTVKQNYPNPFNPTTVISYGLPEMADVIMTIYDLRGAIVKEWALKNQSAGWYEVIWDGTNIYDQKVSTGVYIYKIAAGNFIQTKKMVFMK